MRGNQSSESPPGIPTLKRVYPRVCGGTPRRAPRTGIAKGLSPRVRGNPELGIFQVFICTSGLSPRVRGNPSSSGWSGAKIGSIPACAGEPPSGPGAVPVSRVYPRVCGGTELGPLRRWRSLLLGLSPRVRGNLARGNDRGSVGEMGLSPRVRGNHRPAPQTVRSFEQGLSPRVRGNHNPEIPGPILHGSIPACAGEPRTWQCRGSPRWVYPRVCGGTIGIKSRVCRSTQGSIPACAGEPHRGEGASSWLTHRVYPRVCGGTGWARIVADSCCGIRSIPACAGEP